jgi:LPS O-antigen subunit length determinant protein (WzzB/FepE family)
MAPTCKLQDVLKQAEQRLSAEQKCRVERLHQKFERLAEKGLVERPTYRLALSSSLPTCLSQ